MKTKNGNYTLTMRSVQAICEKLHEIDNEKLLDDLFDKLKNRELELSDKLPTFANTPHHLENYQTDLSPECTLEIWSWSPTRVIIGSCADDIEIIER